MQPIGRTAQWRRAVRCGLVAALVATTLAVAPAPATAQPACGQEGEAVLDSTPWPLRRLEPATVWPLTRGEGVVVAVIDSGVSTAHPTLAGKVLPGRDFGLPDHAGHCDEAGHGTLVAGIIAGRDGTGTPFAGIAPAARILPARVLEDQGPTTDQGLPGRVADAIRWAVDSGADVINLSLETVRTQDLDDAVAYAWDNDVVMVAAAGNVAEGQQGAPAYPAFFHEVVAVAGVNEAGGHVDSSVRGDYLAVAAPGVDIVGPASRGDGYHLVPEGGTSYASAYVSGVVALVRAYHPDLSAAEVMERLMLTADRPPGGRDEQVGYGVVNPYRAVSTVLGVRDNAPAAAVQPSPSQSDPLATQKVVAGWAALGGAALTLLLLLGRPVVRRGRQRGWRPAGRLS